MSAISISSPFPTFTDVDGDPLESGYIYVGQVNVDPVTFPVAVYWDAALTIPAAQPIRTIGGYPARNGSPARIYANSDYSIRVTNKNGSLVYSAPAATDRFSGVVVDVDATDVAYTPAGAGTVATTVQSKLRETLSVKDFGVKADGVSDDWAAWTAFFSEYAARTVTVAGASGFGGTSSYSAPQVVDTLAGKSLLSKPLVLPAYVNMNLSNVMFDRHPSWTEAAGTYLVTSTGIYQAKLGGLSFRGVSYALELKNANLDQGHIHVSGVKFAGGDYAIKVDCRSSCVIISDFKSDRVPHFLLNYLCDQLTLKDGWISQGVLTSAKDATITNYATMIVENVLGVPIQHTVAEVAWFNNYAHVDIRKMRFGGEPGSCAAVNNFATADTTYPISPTSVQVVDCETYSVDTQGGTQTSCIIRLFALPNVLRFRENRGAVDTNNLITWGSTANQAGEIAKAPFCVFDIDKNQYKLFGTPFPANLVPLFSPSSKIALAASSTSANTVVCDTNIIASSGRMFDLVIKGNPRGGGSGYYLSTWRGVISAYSGYNGSAEVRRLSILPIQQANGGPAFASAFTVTATFWNGSSSLTEVPTLDATATLRVTISGWETGFEGANLKGYLLEVTPE